MTGIGLFCVKSGGKSKKLLCLRLNLKFRKCVVFIQLSATHNSYLSTFFWQLGSALRSNRLLSTAPEQHKNVNSVKH